MNRRMFLASLVAGAALPVLPALAADNDVAVYRRTARNGMCFDEYNLLNKYREVLVIKAGAGEDVEELIRQRNWPVLKSPKYRHCVRVLRRRSIKGRHLICIDEEIDSERGREVLERLQRMYGHRTGLTDLLTGTSK